jgi:hypothetical protein
MNENENSKSVWEGIWFFVRWYTGLAIDVLIMLGAALVTGSVIYAVRSVPPETLGMFRYMQSPFVMMAMAIAMFTAMMAGRQWARTQYFTHILPEVWENTVKEFLAKNKDE